MTIMYLALQKAWSDFYDVLSYQNYTSSIAFANGPEDNFYIHSNLFQNIHQENINERGGGAIRYISFRNSYILIEDCTVVKCTSNGNGGGIYVTNVGHTNINKVCGYSCESTGNDRYGQFLYSEGTSNENNVYMTSISKCGNKNYGNSYIFMAYRGNQIISEVNLSNCQSYSYPGIAPSQPVSGSIKFSHISSNEANEKGLFRMNGGLHSAEYCNIINNKINDAITIVDGSTFTFSSTFFKENTANYFSITYSGFLYLEGCYVDSIDKTIGKVYSNDENQIYDINYMELFASGLCLSSPIQTKATPTPKPTPSPSNFQTPDITLEKTPIITEKETINETPLETLSKTPHFTSDLTPFETQKQTVENTPLETIYETPQITQTETEENTPIETIYETPQITQIETPKATFIQTPEVTPKETLYSTFIHTPQITQNETPKATFVNTPETTQFETLELTPYQTFVPVVITTPKETTISIPSRTTNTQTKENRTCTKTMTSTFIVTKTLIVTDTTIATDEQIIYTKTTIETHQLLEVSTATFTDIQIILPEETDDGDRKEIFNFVLIVIFCVIAMIFLCIILICCARRIRNQELSAFGLSTSVHLLEDTNKVTYFSPMVMTNDESLDDPFKEDFLHSYIEEASI